MNFKPTKYGWKSKQKIIRRKPFHHTKHEEGQITRRETYLDKLKQADGQPVAEHSLGHRLGPDKKITSCKQNRKRHAMRHVMAGDIYIGESDLYQLPF